MMGNPGARTEIVVFSDFQCPHCRHAARELHRLSRSNKNRVKIYFKHFPLDRHPFALDAAKAAEAAKQQEKFWEMHDLLFAWSDEFAPDTFMMLARKLKLDMAKFEEDFDSEHVLSVIKKDKEDGTSLGVKGTPFFFINKIPFTGNASDLRRKI